MTPRLLNPAVVVAWRAGNNANDGLRIFTKRGELPNKGASSAKEVFNFGCIADWKSCLAFSPFSPRSWPLTVCTSCLRSRSFSAMQNNSLQEGRSPAWHRSAHTPKVRNPAQPGLQQRPDAWSRERRHAGIKFRGNQASWSILDGLYSGFERFLTISPSS